MGKQKKVRKFAEMKRLLNPKDVKPYAYLFDSHSTVSCLGFCRMPRTRVHAVPDNKLVPLQARQKDNERL